jgi:hypothetical protein
MGRQCGGKQSGRFGSASTPAIGRAVCAFGAAFYGPRERGPFRLVAQLRSVAVFPHLKSEMWGTRHFTS